MHYPRTIKRLWGHDKAVSQFTHAFELGKLFHGWLLDGPWGIGKTSFAYAMAHKLLDSGTKGQGKLIELGSHPDLLEIGRTQDEKKDRLRREIVVEDIRKINRFLHQTPALGGWRIVIIDEAETLNRNAANSLLKILEEPPEKSIIFLVCHGRGRLLSTLRSRCIELSFQSLNDEDMLEILAQQAPDTSLMQRKAVLAIAGGSPGMALILLEENGLFLYHQAQNLASSHMTRPEASKLTDILLKDEEKFFLYFSFLARVLHQKTQEMASKTPLASLSPLGRRKIQENLSLWQKIMETANTVERFNLDKRQALLNLFDLMRII
ncbi:AAA family ATPase [Entomobacter blattae]|uniref:DNA polymerase III, delta subunit n=1 Tax=Entomobacter blattae TaxID=2762277 RepID=A0A7H1NT15_9PROT|nr:AAA family ATPase [Entomobacter blattae]QNT78925.1 DNA polymerase III, delta subunit [Entomobacter blattae]